MAKKPVNSGKAWTPAAQKQLVHFAKGNTPTRLIALKMGRSPSSIANQASKSGVSLNPPNQSPYGTKK